jgi:16S rRNA (uracil1498-N3)-methyltransferase
MANLYFTDESLAESTRSVALTGDESRHAAQVARLRVGESIEVSDGRGWRVHGTVAESAPSRVVVTVERIEHESSDAPRFVLVQALAKGDRDELAVQTATELGVDDVVPWQAERSVSRWSGDKVAKGVARWQTIVREAAKQSMRSHIPEVHDPVSTNGITRSVDGTTWLVLDPRAEHSIREWAEHAGTPETIGVIVGPEGGISPAELNALVAAGATPIRLGPHVLRTSTAGPAALATLGALFRRW